jgi:hypothetical protein
MQGSTPLAPLGERVAREDSFPSKGGGCNLYCRSFHAESHLREGSNPLGGGASGRPLGNDCGPLSGCTNWAR